MTLPPDAAPALHQLASVPAATLSVDLLRRTINRVFGADAALNAFLRSQYRAIAREASDNMQRLTKLNILFSHETDLARLRYRLVRFCRDEAL